MATPSIILHHGRYVHSIFRSSYVIPMLENAGAIVYTPRERDTQKNEIIVDNDTPNASLYLEVGSKKANWTNAPVRGFAQKKTIYKEGENPFTDGTCRFIPTERKKKKNKDQVFAEWVPTLPATGKYAVYVSYQTLPNSVSDAKYLVFHNGGVTEFKVNQKIGGGTWVYLGTLNLIKGTTTTAWWYLATRAANMELYAPMQYVLEVEWETLPVEEEPAGCPVTWKEHATLRNGGMPYEVYAGRKGEKRLYRRHQHTFQRYQLFVGQFCLQPATIGFKRTFGNDYGVAQ